MLAWEGCDVGRADSAGDGGGCADGVPDVGRMRHGAEGAGIRERKKIREEKREKRKERKKGQYNYFTFLKIYFQHHGEVVFPNIFLTIEVGARKAAPAVLRDTVVFRGARALPNISLHYPTIIKGEHNSFHATLYMIFVVPPLLLTRYDSGSGF